MSVISWNNYQLYDRRDRIRNKIQRNVIWSESSNLRKYAPLTRFTLGIPNTQTIFSPGRISWNKSTLTIIITNLFFHFTIIGSQPTKADYYQNNRKIYCLFTFITTNWIIGKYTHKNFRRLIYPENPLISEKWVYQHDQPWYKPFFR